MAYRLCSFLSPYQKLLRHQSTLSQVFKASKRKSWAEMDALMANVPSYQSRDSSKRVPMDVALELFKSISSPASSDYESLVYFMGQNERPPADYLSLLKSVPFSLITSPFIFNLVKSILNDESPLALEVVEKIIDRVEGHISIDSYTILCGELCRVGLDRKVSNSRHLQAALKIANKLLERAYNKAPNHLAIDGKFIGIFTWTFSRLHDISAILSWISIANRFDIQNLTPMYNHLLGTYLHRGHFEFAKNLFGDMLADSSGKTFPNHHTAGVYLTHLFIHDRRQALEVFMHLQRYHDKILGTKTWNSVLWHYAKRGIVGHVEFLWSAMQKQCVAPDDVTYMALIVAYATRVNIKTTNDGYFRLMDPKRHLYSKGSISLPNPLPPFVKCKDRVGAGLLNEAQAMSAVLFYFDEMKSAGLLSAKGINTMVEMHLKFCCYEDAVNVLAKTPPLYMDIISFNTLTALYLRFGMEQKAQEVFVMMRENNVRVDEWSVGTWIRWWMKKMESARESKVATKNGSSSTSELHADRSHLKEIGSISTSETNPIHVDPISLGTSILDHECEDGVTEAATTKCNSAEHHHSAIPTFSEIVLEGDAEEIQFHPTNNIDVNESSPHDDEIFRWLCLAEKLHTITPEGPLDSLLKTLVKSTACKITADLGWRIIRRTTPKKSVLPASRKASVG